MNRQDALAGALVADAASMGTHWLYDQAHIKTLEAAGDIAFRQPDVAHYENRQGYFAHAGRRSGELSHYGESARIVGSLAIKFEYSTDAHRERFMQSFGPCGSFRGYADRPTKALVATCLSSDGPVADPSGSDDDQMPALCVVPGLFAGGYGGHEVEAAVQVLSIHADAIAGVRVVFNCLERLQAGEGIEDALSNACLLAPDDLQRRLQTALGLPSYQPLEAAEQFGMPCHMSQGLPVVWHLLKHADDFEGCVRDNIRCGGDNCGRAMALGAIAGALFGVPDKWVTKLAVGVL